MERTLTCTILYCTSNQFLSFSFFFLVDKALSPPERGKWDIHDCTEILDTALYLQYVICSLGRHWLCELCSYSPLHYLHIVIMNYKVKFLHNLVQLRF